jgi:hypothetical protein
MFAVLGTIVGNQTGYWAGRQGGRPFVLRWDCYLGLTYERLVRVEALFARQGGRAVFLAHLYLGSGPSVPCSRYKPHVLENLPLLQRPGGGVVGHGFDLDRVPI